MRHYPINPEYNLAWIWPDNDWCWAEDMEFACHKSDDYMEVMIHEDVEDNFPSYDEVALLKSI